MNKSFIRVASALAFVVLSLSLVFSGCVDRPESEVNADWSGKEEFIPSTGIGKDTVALAARYAEYKENAGLAFKQNQAAPDSAFTVSDYEGGVKINAYVGNDNIIVIPESIGGKTVLAIGEGAFSSAFIRAIYVPNSVVYIEKSAFEGASSVTTLRLPFVGDGKKETNFGYIFGSNDYSNNALKVPASLEDIENKAVFHNVTVEKEDMLEFVSGMVNKKVWHN